MFKKIRYIFCFAALSGCMPHYLIVTQDQITKSPCVTAGSGVNVRIRNSGKVTFTKVVLTDTKAGVEFPGLNPGQVSCYKNQPYLYSNPSLNLLLSKRKGYVKTLMLVSTDHIGESKMQQGYFTINIKVISTHGQFKATYNLSHEKIDSLFEDVPGKLEDMPVLRPSKVIKN